MESAPLFSRRLIIFTDLDGTLLDHFTYSFDPAARALERISRQAIPLVIVSSKTRYEIEPIVERLHLPGVFVTENGSGIFLSRSLGLVPPKDSKPCGAYHLIRPGMTYQDIIEKIRTAEKACHTKIRGFADMDAEEISQHTGLCMEDAQKAKKRDFSEPFIFEGQAHACLVGHLESMGLTCVQGGRFMHVLGPCSKGNAVKKILEIFSENHADAVWTSVALGDGPNDVDMLEAAAIPVIIQRTDHSYMDLPTGLKTRVIYAQGVGPCGWNHAVNTILDGL